MADPKALTEAGWKAVIQKLKIKDNGLLKSLAMYEKLDEDQFDDLLKCLATILRDSNILKKAKEVAALDEAIEYLDDVIAAANAAKAFVIKASADAAKKAAAAAKEDEAKEADDEEEGGDAIAKLNAALKTIKTAKQPYYFLVCEAKPYGLVLSKKEIKSSAQAKKDLAQLAGGNTRPPKFGTCQFDNGKLVFEMDKPPSGLARILQKWIKDTTGISFKIVVGTESAGDEEGPAAGSPTAAKPVAPALAKAPEEWHGTRDAIEKIIKQLKDAIRREFADHADILKEVEKNIHKLDSVLDRLDVKLAHSLDKARATNDAKARADELKNSKVILTDYIKYIKAEPLITHIDSNPFGVKTNLRQTLTVSLTRMAQAIG